MATSLTHSFVIFIDFLFACGKCWLEKNSTKYWCIHVFHTEAHWSKCRKWIFSSQIRIILSRRNFFYSTLSHQIKLIKLYRFLVIQSRTQSPKPSEGSTQKYIKLFKNTTLKKKLSVVGQDRTRLQNLFSIEHDVSAYPIYIIILKSVWYKT